MQILRCLVALKLPSGSWKWGVAVLEPLDVIPFAAKMHERDANQNRSLTPPSPKASHVCKSTGTPNRSPTSSH